VLVETPFFKVRVREWIVPPRPPYFYLTLGDWVNVVALTPAIDLLMVSQIRLPISRETLEIVAGGVRSGETPRDAAVREVMEETGYSVGRITALGSRYPNPALQTNRLHTFLATNCKPAPTTPRRDAWENVALVIVPARRWTSPEFLRGLSHIFTAHALQVAAPTVSSSVAP
jgi:8-oxo-dGTP pyrophosphatase MutT (NUDIX family)